MQSEAEAPTVEPRDDKQAGVELDAVDTDIPPTPTSTVRPAIAEPLRRRSVQSTDSSMRGLPRRSAMAR